MEIKFGSAYDPYMHNPCKDIQLREDENVKLAYVIINGERKMLGVDNRTFRGYKMRDDVPMWKIPLEEQKYDAFQRWCTNFDV